MHYDMAACTSQCLPLDPSRGDRFFLLDLETTGLGFTADICQIGVVSCDGASHAWSQYVLPPSQVQPLATAVNGLELVVDSSGSTVLHSFKKGLTITDALPYKEGLLKFYQFLKEIAGQTRRVDPTAYTILISHNGLGLDFPVLLRALSKCGVTLQLLEEIGVAFADSLKLLRKMRQSGGLSAHSLSMENLHFHLFQADFPAHDAMEDAMALQRVLFGSSIASRINREDIQGLSQTPSSVCEALRLSL